MRVVRSSSSGQTMRSRPVAPGSGRGRGDSPRTPRWSSASSAMRRYVVSLPPATLTIPDGPVEKTVSRRAFAVSPVAAGQHAQAPERARAPGRCPRPRRTPRRAPARRPRSSRTPSPARRRASVSVVPSSSIPSHGTAKVTRTLSWGIVSAASQSAPPSTSTCTPLLSRTELRAAGSSSLRTRSTHGPAALTTRSARTEIVRRRPATSAPSRPRSATTSA